MERKVKMDQTTTYSPNWYYNMILTEIMRGALIELERRGVI